VPYICLWHEQEKPMTVNMTTGQQPHMRFEKGNAQEEDQGHDGNKLENMSQLDQRPWKEMSGSLGKMEMGAACFPDNPDKFENVQG
jgi:hypothetical protein